MTNEKKESPVENNIWSDWFPYSIVAGAAVGLVMSYFLESAWWFAICTICGAVLGVLLGTCIHWFKAKWRTRRQKKDKHNE